MSFPPHPIPEGMLSHSFFWSAEPQRRTAKHLGHTWCIGKRFCKSRCVIISTLSSRIESVEFIDRGAGFYSSTVEKSERQKRSRSEMPVWSVSQKFSHLQRRRLFKELWADHRRLQISDLHFDKFPTPATFACWKIRFKTEVCICSQFPTEAMQWIKEVDDC